MVPSIIVALEALPLTSNGKIDRKALPDPELKQVEYVAPRTPTESKLCKAWAEALGVERVGVHDDFFALGAHSLLAMKVARDTGYDVAQLCSLAYELLGGTTIYRYCSRGGDSCSSG